MTQAKTVREVPKLTEYIREIDVLKQWPLSRATLIRARKKGLPYVKLGAFICYKPEDIEAFFAERGVAFKEEGHV